MNPIVLALDVPDLESAKALLDKVGDSIGVVKIGLQLFTAVGPEVFKATKLPIFLDLKLHDIPETVEHAVGAAIQHGIKYLTIHCQQSRATLERAFKKTEGTDTTLVGVTVLTSDVEKDLWDLTIHKSPGSYAMLLAERAAGSGLTAFVCSPLEVRSLRRVYCPSGTLITPGIRTTDLKDDQKRVGTPEQAIADGANLLVIGRPIRDAEDPLAAVKQIQERISNAKAI